MRIIFDHDGEPTAQPDPFVFSYGGKYYIYATGADGVHGYVSDRLDGDWRYMGMVYTQKGRKEFWAPCVYIDKNKIYLYYSSVPADSDDVHDECIAVAVSDRPDGGFTYVCDLLPPFSIDPHVVESGGSLYIFYSVNDYEAARAGTYIVVQKMASPVKVEGAPTAVVRPTLDEEIFMRDRFRKGQHWHTLEGAFYFREGDYHYLIYSGNCYMNEKYYLGYAVAHTTETDLTKVRFQKMPSDDTYCPLIAQNEWETGTGHNSVIKDGGKYYCVYHGREAGETRLVDTRSARLCELVVKDGTLTAIRSR